MKRFAMYLLIMALLCVPAAAWGEGQDQTEDPAEYSSEEAQEGPGEEAVELPPLHYLMEPDIHTWLGFRFVDVDGSKRALEYGWPFSSAAGGFKLEYSPLPHRLDTELDWLNVNDYRAEFSYAFRDLLKLDYIGTSLWHNLDHFAPQPAVSDRNPTAGYAVDVRDNRIKLRLKWPDRAYHVFAEFRQFEKEGTIQQRFRTSSKSSRSRDIDWITRQYMAGINGHFGPVEIEYSHRIRTFDPGKDVRMIDTFPGFPFFGAQVLHNVVPEIEANTDTVKVHTDLTGRIAASATFINGEKDNDTSSAKVDFRRAYGDLTIIPFEHFTVALRYRYKELLTESPAVIGTNGLGIPGVTKDPIDKKTNRAEATLRYSPTNSLALKAEYVFENVDKEGVELWSDRSITPFQDLPAEQNIHTVRAGVNARPLRALSFKALLDYSYTGDPAYATDPTNSYKGSFDADWAPTTALSAGAYYRFTREENNTADMRAEKDNMGAYLTWAPLERLSFYAGYDYSRLKDERDMRLASGTGEPFPVGDQFFFPVDRAPYDDSSHLYALGMGYSFAIPLSVNAEFRQGWSKGRFRTSVFEPVNAISSKGVGELTDLSLRETGGSLNAKYSLPMGWGASLAYTINNFEDLLDKPQDGQQDGTAHTVLVMLTKKW